MRKISWLHKADCPFCEFHIETTGVDIDVGGVLSNHITEHHEAEMWTTIFAEHMPRVKSILLGNSMHKSFARLFASHHKSMVEVE